MLGLSQYIKLPALLLAVVFVALFAAPSAYAQTTALTDNQLEAKAQEACKNESETLDRFRKSDKGACKAGFKGGYKDQSEGDICAPGVWHNKVAKCESGYAKGVALRNGTVTPAAPGNPVSSPNDIPESDTGCGTDFDWVLCKIIRGAQDTVGWIEDNFIEPFLDVTPLLFSANPIYDIWKVMRDLANGLFVVVFLVFIFAQTLSLNLDAYAIRKIIPKLVAAAILVQLSYLLSSLAIDIFNVLGRGLFLLTNAAIPPYSPAAGANTQGGSFLGFAFLVGGAATLAVSAAISVSLVPIMIAAVIGALAVFFTLVFRQILVVLLVVTAPLAIVAWVLPSTEKMFKKWLDLFVRVLFMYPIIVMLFAAGKLFAASAGATNATFAPIFALVGVLIPLFIIPLSFKFAGGVVSTVGALALKRGGAFGKKVSGSGWAKNRAEQNKEDAFIRHKSLQGETGFKSAFGRARARGMTGNLFPTVRNQRDLNKGYDKAEKDQITTHTARLESDPNMNPGTLVNLATGKSVPGYETSRTMQMAAIKRLAKTNDADNLRAVRTQLAHSQNTMSLPQSQAVDKMYDRAISDEFGDVRKIAPDLTAAPSVSMPSSLKEVAEISPDRASTLASSTIDHFMQNADDTQKTQFFQSVSRMGAPGRGKMDPNTIAAIKKQAALGNFDTVGGSYKYKDAAGNEVTGTARQWIDNNINNGRWT